MYFLYVDESGDTGLQNSPTTHFALTGLVLHELRWSQTLDAIIDFRRQMRIAHGLKLREEIHCKRFFNKPGDLARMPKWERLLILRQTLDFQAKLPDVNVIAVIVDKRTKKVGYDVFENAWRALVQRFENTISRRNFPGPRNPSDLGIVITDRTDEKKLRGVMRRMRRFNPVPSLVSAGTYRQLPLLTVAEDAVHRDSLHSYFVQLADVNSYFLRQKLSPNSLVRKNRAQNYFDRLGPVLCKVANRRDPQGIVRL